MKVRFVANASFEVTSASGKRLITDPWWEPGTYLGTWHNFPPVPDALREEMYAHPPDLIYVSHLHPDHFDRKTLSAFELSTPVLIGCIDNGHLKRALRGLGFLEIVEVDFWEWNLVKGFEVMLLPQFRENSFGAENSLGYELDTSIVVRDQGQTFLNLVDNSVSESQARHLRERLGVVSIAAVPYSGASAYPHAFRYPPTVKRHKALELRARFLSQFRRVVEEINPRVVVPAAGSYVFPSFMSEYNRYLQQATPSEIEAVMVGSTSPARLVNLAPGESIWCEGEQVSHGEVQSWTESDRYNYGRNLVGCLSYEKLEVPDDLSLPWTRILNRCAQNLASKQRLLGVFVELEIQIQITQRPEISFAFVLSEDSTPAPSKWLSFQIDERLLLLIVTGAVDWNNAEVGSHVLIDREPDQFNATAHSLMSYFSLVS